MTAIGTVVFFVLAVALNAAAGYAAHRREAVTLDGAIAGALLGATILAAGGFFGWIMLMLFFVGSTVASRIGAPRKASLGAMHEKSDQRDAVQVAANGGVAAVALVAHRLTGEPAFAAAAAGAFAAANADTWASELGVLSRVAPRLVFSRRRVEPGRSGGVSTAGTLAGLLGSLLIAGWYAFALGVTGQDFTPLWTGGSLASGGEIASGGSVLPAAIVWFAGFVGTSVDSILGAAIQARYRDTAGGITERRTGDDGPNELVHGIRFVTNDVVNALSVLAAAIVAGTGAWLAAGPG